jgi:hypothetical protein
MAYKALKSKYLSYNIYSVIDMTLDFRTIWCDKNVMQKKRSVIGYVFGKGGRFDHCPFYRLELPLAECRKLEELLAAAGGEQRRTATLTATRQQMDRLCVTGVGPPKYEQRAVEQYVRGDVLRVQGTEGNSCNLTISARFGVPLMTQQLGVALERAREFVELRVPSRKYDLVEFVPDVDLDSSDEQILAAGSIAATVVGLAAEDFSDWEK